MKIVLTAILALITVSVVSAEEVRYEVVRNRMTSCYRNDLVCREGVRNAVINEVHTYAANHCKNTFGNKAKVVDWDAYCSGYFYAEQTPPIPPPPQPPTDFPITVKCTAKVIYTCE